MVCWYSVITLRVFPRKSHNCTKPPLIYSGEAEARGNPSPFLPPFLFSPSLSLPLEVGPNIQLGDPGAPFPFPPFPPFSPSPPQNPARILKSSHNCTNPPLIYFWEVKPVVIPPLSFPPSSFPLRCPSVAVKLPAKFLLMVPQYCGWTSISISTL